MSKIHFDPYGDDYSCVENTPCGVRMPEDYKSSSLWTDVDCKRCLYNRAKLTDSFKENEKAIVNQMGDMADYLEYKE